MSLLSRIKDVLHKDEPGHIVPAEQFYADEFPDHTQLITDPAQAPRRIPKGRIIKADKQAEYTPRIQARQSGVIRTMPRAIRKIKEAQEHQAELDRTVSDD